MTEQAEADFHNPMSAFLSALVPMVPSLEAQEVIRHIFGAVGPGQNDRHMQHWNQGKTIQQSGGDVPKKHENEHAVGLYDQELRPVLIETLLKWMKDHGADISDYVVPKSTNRLCALHRGYRIENNPVRAEIEVYRPDFTLAKQWDYTKGDIDSIPAFSMVRLAIDRDIEERLSE